MKNKVSIGITLVGLIIGGISYWFQPYGQLQIIGSFIPVIWSLGAFLGSLILMIVLNKKPPKIALLISLGVMLAILARIIYDTTFWDSTSHNLAPFEIIICGFVTIPSAFVGVFVPILLKKFKKS